VARPPSFSSQLEAAGAELLAPTNCFEVMRFRTLYGVGVIYKGRRGETWNQPAVMARDHIKRREGSLSPVKVRGRRKDMATVSALLKRDGGECFFCGVELGGDITVEHLVAIAHGGPNHISNLYLAHGACNREAGHRAAPVKVALAIEKRAVRLAIAEGDNGADKG
jgi:5-methylcytosine-specific restriction endonuclease McrA